MALLIRDNQVYKGEELVYEAPAPITETAILDDGIIVLYDYEEIIPKPQGTGKKPTKQNIFDIRKNVIKIDMDGKLVWQIDIAPPDGSDFSGYLGLTETVENTWHITSGKYVFTLDTDTGALDLYFY